MPYNQGIRAGADAWARHERSSDHLYRGSVLLEAELWSARNIPSAQEAAFLTASRGA